MYNFACMKPNSLKVTAKMSSSKNVADWSRRNLAPNSYCKEKTAPYFLKSINEIKLTASHVNTNSCEMLTALNMFTLEIRLYSNLLTYRVI